MVLREDLFAEDDRKRRIAREFGGFIVEQDNLEEEMVLKNTKC